MTVQHAVDRAEEIARYVVPSAVVVGGVSIQQFGNGIVQLAAVAIAVGVLWQKVLRPTGKHLAAGWRKIDLTWDAVQEIPDIKEQLRAQAELHIMGTALAAEQARKVDELAASLRTITRRDPGMRTRRTDRTPEEMTE